MSANSTNNLKRKLLRGATYLVVALLAWGAGKMGLLDTEKLSNTSQQTNTHQTQSSSGGFEPIQTNSKGQASNSSGSITTLRLEDPLERGENHKVTNETKTVKTWNHKRSNDNAKIAQLFKQKKSDTWVTAYGKVGKVLPDDNKGSRHQRFLLDIGQQKWLLVAHNIDLAPYVPLKKGDQLIVHGEYEYNDKGGVIHWTHHDPRGYKDGGYIELNNKRYE